MMRPVLLFACLAVILTVAGCASPPQRAAQTTSSQETTLSSEVATQFATMDEAVRALVDGAERDDVAYFAALGGSSDATGTRVMMKLVRQSDMASTYRSRGETSTDGTFRLDYHDRGNFQVDMISRDGRWSVLRLWH